MKLKLYLARIPLLKWGITSGPLREGEYFEKIGDSTTKLSHSGFNVKWLVQLGIKPEVILELGSYDGGDARRFYKAFPNSRIITVEADPDRARVVQNNLTDTTVEMLNSAVCEKNGPVEWHSAFVDGGVNAQGSLYKHSDLYKNKFPQVKQSQKVALVDGLRLDTLCDKVNIQEIDSLHMDIEGAEFSALSGMGEIRPKLIFFRNTIKPLC